MPLAVPLTAGPSTIAFVLLLSSSRPDRLLDWSLALVLLAPRWWGYTGLGDWDLVQVSGDPLASDPEANLISEEADPAAAGEATASLCLANAPELCAHRSSLRPLSGGGPAFTLLLSTDGVRKSCDTEESKILRSFSLSASSMVFSTSSAALARCREAYWRWPPSR
mgnify:CR=1 FL=1